MFVNEASIKGGVMGYSLDIDYLAVNLDTLTSDYKPLIVAVVE